MMYKKICLLVLFLSAVVIAGCASEYYGSDEEYPSPSGANRYALQHSADRGDSQSEYSLGMRYLLGRGTPIDYSKAYKWLERSASQGNPYAENELGYMYMSGLGVNQDYQEAFKWYGRSANHGLASAQYNLGFMYQNGLGMKAPDLEKAREYYQMAAASHFGPAERALAQLKHA